MHLRKLGRTGLDVPPLCVGGNVFGWTVDEATSYRLLDAMFDAGLNFIDTADVYSSWAPGNQGGESEGIIGRWMHSRGNRDRVIVATKVGSPMGEGKKGLSARYIGEAVEASLRRLQTDVIDLYQSHWDDPDTPFEETLGAYQRLIQQGKVRAIGASNLDAGRLRQSLDVAARTGLPRYETLQPEYNLYARESFEGDLAELCLREEIGVITYFSLAAGFLSGKYRSEADAGKSARGKGIVEKYLTPRGHAILGALDEVSAALNATPTQVALAWLMAKPAVTAPIASATSLDQVADLVAAANLALDAEQVRRLDQASATA
jgi:aryl-alcohol dehydrogenase-like predicted oxidoreductase